MSIQEKLLKIQSQLKAPKNQYNSFGKYKYRSCEDILEGVKPLLLENGLTMTITDNIVECGSRIYIQAIVVIRDGDDSIDVCAYARESETKKGMDESQITGTASSYARKYALNGMFLIDDTKDAYTQDNIDTETLNVNAVLDDIKNCKSKDQLNKIRLRYGKLKWSETELAQIKAAIQEFENDNP